MTTPMLDLYRRLRARWVADNQADENGNLPYPTVVSPALLAIEAEIKTLRISERA